MRQVAVSDRDGRVTLAEVPVAAAKGEWVTPGTDGMEWSMPDWGAAIMHDVPCIKLDTLAAEVGTPDLVVIDTEGHEVKILQGAVDILAERHAGWVIEFHTPDNMNNCKSILEGAGCAVEIVRHPHYAPMTAMWYQHGWLRGVVAADGGMIRGDGAYRVGEGTHR
jgi:hypothetical protein